ERVVMKFMSWQHGVRTIITTQGRERIMGILARIFAIVLGLMGIGLAAGGAYLITLAGSPYYLIAGLVYLIAAVFIWRAHRIGGLLVVLVALLTLPWALWESGLDYWALFPRLMGPLALAAIALLLSPSLLPSPAAHSGTAEVYCSRSPS